MRGGTLPDCSSTCYTNVDTNCPSYVDANCAALYHCNASGVCYDGYYPSTGSYPNGTFWNVACWPTGTVVAGNAVPNSKDCAKEFYCQAECVRNPLTYFCVQGDYSGTTSHPTPQYRQYGAACGGS